MTGPRRPGRAELLDRLATLNVVLYRHGAVPIMTPSEAVAADLADDNLAAVVALTADRVVTVARALQGIP